MSQLRLIAFKELGDRFRSGWVIACGLVWLGAIVLTSLFGLSQIGQIGLQGYQRTVVSLLNLVQYLVPLLALLLGHDLVVSEREERTLALVLASGVPRRRVLAGKFLGGCLTLAIPLGLGFAMAGAVIALGSDDGHLGAFVRLALSGLGLGLVFLAVGLAISALCRTRVQALVASLLAWGVAVFVFDLAALGWLMSTQATAAAQDIEINCEATHVTAGADLHAEYELPSGRGAKPPPAVKATSSFASLLLINPVDLFRALNLPAPLAPAISPAAVALSAGLWLAAALGTAVWRLRKVDV